MLTVFFCPFIKAAWEWLAAHREVLSAETQQTEDKKKERIRFFRDWGILFLCWIPVFLAFYPGAFAYDAQTEYVQVASRNFTTHHPLMHVLLLGGMIRGGNKLLGSYNVGIALYTILQMLVLSAVFSYTISWLYKRIKKPLTEVLALLFYGLFPVIPMYAVCTTKDTLFTAALLVVIVQMLTLFENPEKYFSKKRNWFMGITAAVAMMLLRNNGAYAYAVWIVAAFFILCLKKQKAALKGSFLGMTGAAVLTFLVISQLLAFVCKAEPGGKQEIFTVPIQQLARTYVFNPESYSTEDREILLEVLPEEEMTLQRYNPRLSDLLKVNFDNEAFAKNPADMRLCGSGLEHAVH